MSDWKVRNRTRRKKMPVHEKVEKSFVAHEGQQVGSLQRVRAYWANERSKVARRCCAKHISRVKMLKAHHCLPEHF